MFSIKLEYEVLAILLVFREINFILGTALSNLCIIT